MTQMFQNCVALRSVALFNTQNVTSFAQVFQGCTKLPSVPNFNTSKVTTFSSTFANCYSLAVAPNFDTALCTNFSAMFQGCFSLLTVPAYNTSIGNTFTQMFFQCYNLAVVPTMTLVTNTVNALTNIVGFCSNIGKLGFTNISLSINVASLKLSKENLEEVFYNIANNRIGQTITITGAYGTFPGLVTLTGTSTVGTNTISMVSTTGLQVGMQVTGTGSPLTTAIAVTFTDVGDTVNLNSHGLSDGDEVSFVTITTTTGIVINTIYYVVGATTNTFQVATTLGGSARPLTNNGSGAIRYKTEIVTINTNASVVVSRPMTVSNAVSFAYRQLKTGTALLRGWTVTG
jgi:hypothetical protein